MKVNKEKVMLAIKPFTYAIRTVAQRFSSKKLSLNENG